jgi:general stress protein 26
MTQEELKLTILGFLRSHHKAVLATDGDDNHPTTSLMLYVADNDLSLYFGTRKSFAKYGIMQRHPYVSASIIQEGLDPQKTVEIRGKIDFIPDDQTAERLQHFQSLNPCKFYVCDADDFVMFKVVPSFVRYLDATTGELTLSNFHP